MTGLGSGAALTSTVQLAAAGDEVAFARIAETYQPEMLRVAYLLCGDWSLAQDAAQAALWTAWRKLPSLRDPERLRPWLLAVAANEGRQLIRRQRRRSVTEIRATSLDPPPSDPSSGISQLDLANALGHLRPEERTLIALRYVADLDSTEIAAAVGISASGVRSRFARLLDRLRKELGDA